MNQNRTLFEENLDDDDDEWFFQSIRRYEELLMFNVQGSVTAATFCDDTRLLLAVSRDEVHEVWELRMPEKLLAGKEAGLIKNRDFSHLSAGYTKDTVTQMCVAEGRAVVASGQKGVKVYMVPEAKSESDVISLNTEIRSDVVDAMITTSNTTVYSGTHLHNLTSFDLLAQNLQEFKPFTETSSSSTLWDDKAKLNGVWCIADSKLYCGLGEHGQMLTYDNRSGTAAIWVRIGEDCEGEGPWNMDISREGCIVALAGASGTVKVFDLRMAKDSIYTDRIVHQDCLVTVPPVILLSPSDESLFSVSGKHNTTVTIVNCNEGQVFVHDGHREPGVAGVVAHLWHPTQQKLLLSADDTGQLQAWKFRNHQFKDLKT